MKTKLHRALALLALALPAAAQFGGNGSDGAWAPTGSATLDPDESGREGEFHFTSFHVPEGTTTTIIGDPSGQPAKIYVQGDVQIDGSLSVARGTSMGEYGHGFGYPGTIHHGGGASSYAVNAPGDATPYNSPFLHLPLGGASDLNTPTSSYHGGGFLEIEASGAIHVAGFIVANSDRGAGGAICLRSASLVYLAPTGTIHARRTHNNHDNGYIRIESSIDPILEGELRPSPYIDSRQRMLGDVWTVTSEVGDELTQTRPFDGSQQAFSLLGGAFGVTSSLRGAVWVSFPELNQIHPYGRDGLDLLPGKVISTGGNSSPRGIAVDRLDRVWVACGESHRLRYYDPAGRERLNIGLDINPYAVAVDQDADCWVTCTGGGTLYEYTNTGTQLHDLAIGDSPRGVAVDTEGNVWVALAGDLEATQGFVKKISQAGEELGTFEVGFRPNGVAVDASGRVWVANEGDIITDPGSSVTALDLSGNLLGNYTVGIAPNSVSIGGDGTVWVTNGGTPFDPASSLMQLNPETGEILAEYALPDRSVAFGDATGYQAAMRVDPLGDADGDNASNFSEMTEGGDPFNPYLSPNSDCNENGIPDVVDIGENETSLDCNGNSIPDECDIGTISNDCNGNDVPDECDVVFGGFSTDCNANGIPDECDVAGNSTLDLNGNGVLDDCECHYLSYCMASPNSTGNGAVLVHSGTLSCLLNNVTLITTHCPTNKFGIYFYGSGQVSTPFGDGTICAGSPYARLPVIFTGPNGVGAYSMDLNAPTPFGMHIDPHETWNFQFWFRDPNGPLGNGFNFSNGLELTFCP